MILNSRANSISLYNINEAQGALTFIISEFNIDSSTSNFFILNQQIRNSKFILYIDRESNLVFKHLGTKMGVRIASVNIGKFDLKGDIFIALTWDEKENKLFAGEWDKGNILKSTAKQLEGLVRLGSDGSLYQIGDQGGKVGYYHIRQDGKDILFPSAKELWDFTIEKVNIIIDGCELKDYLFQTILVQQCLVMLTTGLELYAKNRLLEMENEGKSADIDKILDEFAKKADVRSEVDDFANDNGLSMLHGLIRVRGQGLINFQDWKQMKTAYNKGFNIKFGEIAGLKNAIIQKIQTYSDWRHKIIHSKMDMSILNIDKIQNEDPIFSDKKFIESARDDFIEFIEKLHKETQT